MHIADVTLGNLGANGIVGAGIPIAVGAAFSIAYRGTTQISVCYFGDAASNQGAFHEAVNMAACMGFPCCSSVENNQYGLSTHIQRTCPTTDISDKAHGYGIEHATVDGMDAEECFRAARKAVAYVSGNRGLSSSSSSPTVSSVTGQATTGAIGPRKRKRRGRRGLP